MPRRVFQGVVVSNACDKTVTVKVERMERHPVYKKFIKKTRKFAAHDNANAYQVGDTVIIQECRPISKSKTWQVVEKVKS